jgi:hypothetical protein
MILFVDSDNVIELDSLVDSRDGTTYVNDATVTFTMANAAGTNITGAIGLPMPYVAASNGKYQGIVPFAVMDVIAAGARGTITIVAVSGAYRVARQVEWLARFKGEE